MIGGHAHVFHRSQIDFFGGVMAAVHFVCSVRRYRRSGFYTTE
jgi:hypothetical protein